MGHPQLAGVNGVAGGSDCPQAPSGRRRQRRWQPLVVCLLALPLTGCTSLSDYIRNGFMVGPHYQTPPAPVAQQWIDANDVQLRKDTVSLCDWWKVFDDPQLNTLVCAAYHQNLTLRQAGFVILQSRAERAISIGAFFPQTQQFNGDHLREAEQSGNGRQRGVLRRFPVLQPTGFRFQPLLGSRFLGPLPPGNRRNHRQPGRLGSQLRRGVGHVNRRCCQYLCGYVCDQTTPAIRQDERGTAKQSRPEGRSGSQHDQC